jgi:cyanate permease
MIFIVIALFAVTYLFCKPALGRKLTRKETVVLFTIYLCVGITVRAILLVFGM